MLINRINIKIPNIIYPFKLTPKKYFREKYNIQLTNKDSEKLKVHLALGYASEESNRMLL